MKPLAIIDVETTGLNYCRHDRVVELATLLLVPGKGIINEFTTLVNPERDVGPTRIHGITASDVINAPRFSDIASHVSEILRNATLLAGHNVRFDISFLKSEFMRIGVEMPHYTTLDTMTIAGKGTLTACCLKHGVVFDGNAHSAMHDARATASLLEKLLAQDLSILAHYEQCDAPIWPPLAASSAHPLPRGSASRRYSGLPSYVQRLMEHLPVLDEDASEPKGERDYRSLLWRVLEDGRISESEGEALVEIATHWGLPFKRIEAIHLGYLSEIVKVALADSRITDAERNEIQMAAESLGFGVLSSKRLQDLLRSCEISVSMNRVPSSLEQWSGKTVCFTGQGTCCIEGQIISRQMAERIAAEKGLVVVPSVTKTLDLLVVADPNTQSGKAKMARRYGIGIVHEPIFWRRLNIEID